ncbi:Carbamate kinase 1 [bacterium HR10]|nr:Carbamate kinase 1 [bacterium HR10]
MSERLVIALGGNALIAPGQAGTIPEQLANLEASLGGVVELIGEGHRIALTHGNGPQVGNILIRVEEARGKAYDLPLDVCVAQSQGEMGYLIQRTLHNLLRRRGIARPVVTVLTQVVVDRQDPRLQMPTKPIGPFYTAAQAEELKRKGYALMEDAHRGYRRVVPSPAPLRIVEQEVITRLFEDGVIVVAAGGGGIPVAVGDGRLVGIEAVVDKDLASSLLATALRADRLLDLTAVETVKLHFGTPRERAIERMTLAEARHYLAEGHFAPGSMGPKIEAAIAFLQRGGREVIITRPELAAAAFRGQAGTHIYPE